MNPRPVVVVQSNRWVPSFFSWRPSQHDRPPKR